MTLSYRIKKRLRDFTLDVQGEISQGIHGVLGPSGAGKTMFLSCIAGFEIPDEGYIELNGKVLFDSSQGINVPVRLRQIGLVFQSLALFPHYTVKDQIAYGISNQAKDGGESRVKELIQLMELQGLEDVYPQHLSGGQKQRVALARAMAPNPSVMLLDEPFSALDEALRLTMVQEIKKELAGYQGVTLFVTHQIDDALALCSEMTLIQQGQCIASGDGLSLLENPPNTTAAKIMGYRNIASYYKDDRGFKIPSWGIYGPIIEADLSEKGMVVLKKLTPVNSSEGGHEKPFKVWAVEQIATRRGYVKYLKIGSPPEHSSDYHLVVIEAQRSNCTEPKAYRLSKEDVVYVEK